METTEETALPTPYSLLLTPYSQHQLSQTRGHGNRLRLLRRSRLRLTRISRENERGVELGARRAQHVAVQAVADYERAPLAQAVEGCEEELTPLDNVIDADSRFGSYSRLAGSKEFRFAKKSSN